MIELLVATMKQTNIVKLAEQMNIKTDAIISNQTDKVSYEELSFRNHTIKSYSFNEVGVGLNRNNALLRSKSEICVLSDDDLSYYSDYPEKITKAFEKYSNADVIIFNLTEKNPNRFNIRKCMKINWLNYTKFGAARIAFRRESVVKKRVTFSTLFGGGAQFSAGEDTLFLHDCLKAGLKIIAVPISIAYLNDSSPSSWFKGFNEKLLRDTGSCYSELFKFQYFPRVFYFAIKNINKYRLEGIGFFRCLKLITEGKTFYKSRSSK